MFTVRTTRVVARMTAIALMTAIGATVLAAGPADAAFQPTPRASWNPTTGTVYTVTRVGQAIVLGGSFTALRSPDDTTTVARSNLAAVDAVTGALLPWNPGTNGEVRALKASADGSTVYVGGAFTTAAGGTASRLAAIRMSDGARLPGFTASVASTVRGLELIGGTLYLGGYFTSVNGVARNRLAAIDATTGAVRTGWTGSASGSVRTVRATPDQSALVVGGEFRQLSGQARDFIGSVSVTTGAATTWTPRIPCTDLQNPCYVYDVAMDVATVYAGVGGPGGRVTAYDLGTGQIRWAQYGDGDVQGLTIDGTTLYIGGHFETDFGGQPRAGIAALSTSSGAVLPDFAPKIVNGLGVFSAFVDGDTLWLGGGWTTFDSTAVEQRFTAFSRIPAAADLLAPSAPAALTVTNTTDERVSLSWTAAADDVGVAGYEVLRDGVRVATVGGTTYTDRDLAPQTTYTYTIRAADSAGNWSPPSDPANGTTRPRSSSLVPAGATWRYLSNGSDQGTAWSAPAFADATWSTGDAELGFGDGDEMTLISPLGLTHYFRTSFTLDDPSTLAALTGRLLVDDGAIVYVNGVEVWRANLPTGSVTYQTSAVTDISGSAERAWSTRSIPLTALVAGRNVVAVEVHNRTASTDVSFDLELVPTFAVPPDTSAPSVPQNLRSTAATTTSIALAWDAATDDTAVTGYRVQRGGAVATTLTGTTWTDGPLAAGTSQTYRVAALDAAGNVSAWSDPLTVSTPAAPGFLVPAGAVWNYTSTAQADGWAAAGFDDSTWAKGSAELGFGDGDEATVVPKGALAYYFRTGFTLDDPTVVSSLSLGLVRDDGAVVYVNGVEVARSNLPTGTITPTTLASTGVYNANESAWFTFTVPTSVLRAGANTVAVEVHQDASNSGDVSFNLRLNAS